MTESKPEPQPTIPGTLREARLRLKAACDTISEIVRDDESGVLKTYISGTLCDPIFALQQAITQYWLVLDTYGQELANQVRGKNP